MPTGYTAAVQDGISFEEFVWRCARNFGALILMRDDPMDAPVPERFEPSDYHPKRLAEAEAELERVSKMSPSKAGVAARKEREEALRYAAEYFAKQVQISDRYRAMIAQVEAWQPPTSEHVGLKEFMLQQLNESLKFDCGYLPDKPPVKSGEEWKRERIAKLNNDIAYHKEELAKEIERTEGRNKWIADLRASVPPPDIAKGKST